jgi:hypothetical protein
MVMSVTMVTWESPATHVKMMSWVRCCKHQIMANMPELLEYAYCYMLRFPWQRDVGTLSRNNGIVQHCCISLATQQLKRRAYQQAAWLCMQQ